MCLIFVGQGYPRKLFNLEHFPIYGTRFNLYFGKHNYRQHKLAKVGIKSCRMCYICVCMDVTTQLELCLREQTQMVANAAYRGCS